MATHAIACEVRVTRAKEFYITHNLSHKSTPVAKEKIPITARQQRQVLSHTCTQSVGQQKAKGFSQKQPPPNNTHWLAVAGVE